MPSVSEFLYSIEVQAVRTKDSETSPVSQAYSQSQFEPEICALSPFHLALFSTKPNGKNYHVLPGIFILITDTKFFHCLSQKLNFFLPVPQAHIKSIGQSVVSFSPIPL